MKFTRYILAMFIFTSFICNAQEQRGADIPWVTYEAENMKTNGIILGPKYDPFLVETESSGQKCVKLDSKGKYVEFKSSTKATSMVVRFSLPDSEDGRGTTSNLEIYINGNSVKSVKITSQLSRLYGTYPFTNNPEDGKPRNFYDEVRLKDIEINQGDEIKIKRADTKGCTASYCIIDLVDLEEIPIPLNVPENSLSVKDFIGENFNGDYTEAFKQCVGKAWELKKTVWIPAGTYKIAGDIFVPSDVKIQGAGMWHTILEGYDSLYEDAGKRIRFFGNGSNIQLSDFSIMGKLNYRNDQEPNDGIVGRFGENSTISRLWIEHTKIGVWVENSKNLVVEGCRFRNLLADGINFCVGMTESTMKNCTARGTGDDCFAMWPATFLLQKYKPGKNTITLCTGQLPFLANGAAIYGGESNKITNCLFTDISPGSAILISTTFPTEDVKVNNHFSGVTVIQNCDIKTSGGFDHSWDWRAAVQICLDKRSISGIEISNLDIENSLSDGIGVVTRADEGKVPTLSNAVFKNIHVSKFGIGTEGKYGLSIDKMAQGSVKVVNSDFSKSNNESKDFTVSFPEGYLKSEE